MKNPEVTDTNIFVDINVVVNAASNFVIAVFEAKDAWEVILEMLLFLTAIVNIVLSLVVGVFLLEVLGVWKMIFDYFGKITLEGVLKFFTDTWSKFMDFAKALRYVAIFGAILAITAAVLAIFVFEEFGEFFVKLVDAFYKVMEDIVQFLKDMRKNMFSFLVYAAIFVFVIAIGALIGMAIGSLVDSLICDADAACSKWQECMNGCCQDFDYSYQRNLEGSNSKYYS